MFFIYYWLFRLQLKFIGAPLSPLYKKLYFLNLWKYFWNITVSTIYWLYPSGYCECQTYHLYEMWEIYQSLREVSLRYYNVNRLFLSICVLGLFFVVLHATLKVVIAFVATWSPTVLCSNFTALMYIQNKPQT